MAKSSFKPFVQKSWHIQNNIGVIKNFCAMCNKEIEICMSCMHGYCEIHKGHICKDGKMSTGRIKD